MQVLAFDLARGVFHLGWVLYLVYEAYAPVALALWVALDHLIPHRDTDTHIRQHALRQAETETDTATPTATTTETETEAETATETETATATESRERDSDSNRDKNKDRDTHTHSEPARALSVS
eukprot:2936008-Rhodomonas_salina.1